MLYLHNYLSRFVFFFFQVEMVRYFFIVLILTLFGAPLMTLIVLNNIFVISLSRKGVQRDR